jgi:hypothetical protein
MKKNFWGLSLLFLYLMIANWVVAMDSPNFDWDKYHNEKNKKKQGYFPSLYNSYINYWNKNPNIEKNINDQNSKDRISTLSEEDENINKLSKHSFDRHSEKVVMEASTKDN